MIKKNLAYISLVGSILGTVGGTATTFAAEQQGDGHTGSKEIEVSYKNLGDIPDPENPDNPEYVVSIPAAIKFSEDNKQVDTKVTMTDPEGETYAGAKKADVTVSSSNNFKLVNKDDQIDYKLVTLVDGQGLLVTADSPEVGQLNKDNQEIDGYAKLVGTAKNVGSYTDSLTYTVTAVTGETTPPDQQ